MEDFVAHLTRQGDSVCRHKITVSGASGPLYSDLYNETRGQLIEAKAGTSRSRTGRGPTEPTGAIDPDADAPITALDLAMDARGQRSRFGSRADARVLAAVRRAAA